LGKEFGLTSTVAWASRNLQLRNRVVLVVRKWLKGDIRSEEDSGWNPLTGFLVKARVIRHHWEWWGKRSLVRYHRVVEYQGWGVLFSPVRVRCRPIGRFRNKGADGT
jgi:hypothetical protein